MRTIMIPIMRRLVPASFINFMYQYVPEDAWYERWHNIANWGFKSLSLKINTSNTDPKYQIGFNKSTLDAFTRCIDCHCFNSTVSLALEETSGHSLFLPAETAPRAPQSRISHAARCHGDSRSSLSRRRYVGRWRVMDFGVAPLVPSPDPRRLPGEAGGSLTCQGLRYGSPWSTFSMALWIHHGTCDNMPPPPCPHFGAFFTGADEATVALGRSTVSMMAKVTMRWKEDAVLFLSYEDDG